MSGGVKVSFNLNGIERKVSPQALAKGKLAIANQMLLDMDQFVPRKGGDLRGSGSVQRDRITYSKPYARAQYYGSSYNKNRSFKFRRYSTPGTGPRWDKKASAIHAKDWSKAGLRAMGVHT